MIEFAWKPDWRWMLLGGLLVIVLLGWSYWSARGNANRGWRIFLTLARLTVLAVVLVCLLDPQFVKETKHYPPSRVAVLLDSSRSMGWKDENGQSRISLAKEWVTQELKLPIGVSLASYEFSSNLVRVPNLQEVEASGDRTSIAEALNQLAMATANDPPDSVILLSDGADNSLRNLEPVARAFGEKHIPIHTVAIGSTNELPDIIIENVQVKKALSKEMKTRAIVTLRGPGYEGLEMPLRIQREGRILGQTDVKITVTSQRAEVEFTPTGSGFQSFTAAIPEQARERRTENNHREFGLSVPDQKIKVLYMEASGFGQGNFQPLYLKRALEDAPDVEIKTLYCEQYGNPRVAVSLQPAYVDPKNGVPIYRVRHPTEGYPRTLEELLQYHVVICSDIPREEFTQQQLENTEKFVTQFGGGFVMVGGHTSFGSGMYQHTIIDKLIPVSMEIENTITGSTFVPRLTPGALDHPLMQISTNKALNQEIWTSKFPPLLGLNKVDRAKPGAVVLLEHPTMRTIYGPNVVLAVQDVGKGRSMAFTSDTTGDWGMHFETIWGEKINRSNPMFESNCDSRYYKQFWLNSVRWLAAHKFSLENNLVNLELESTYCLPGTELPVTVRAVDRQGQEIRDAKVTLTLSDTHSEEVSAQTSYDEEIHGYLGSIRIPKPGTFIITAKAEFKDGRSSEDKQVIVGEEDDIEMGDLRANPKTLTGLSRWSGGRILSPDRSGAAVTSALETVKPPTTEYHRSSLWDRSWVLGLIIGLLGFEWLIRRWRGLA